MTAKGQAKRAVRLRDALDTLLVEFHDRAVQASSRRDHVGARRWREAAVLVAEKRAQAVKVR